MPLPGEINSPVCWSNGCGQDGNYSTKSAIADSKQLKCVSPCMYPWQTPFGVMKESTTKQVAVRVQTIGEFRVPLSDVYPTSSKDISNLTCLIGQRVYYDPYAGSYIVQSAFKSNALAPRALFPGSATLGYISAIDEEKKEVGITIDPRPPTASYTVGLASTATQWELGMPVSIDPKTNVISACTSDSNAFSGVVAGWVEKFTALPSGNIPMIIVSRGQAWYSPKPSTLYSQNERSTLLNTPSTVIPVDVTGAACSIGNNNEKAIIIGNISLNEWYSVDQEFPECVLLDVKQYYINTS